MEPVIGKYRLLIEKLQDGFACHQIITDSKGKPVDYVFLEVNPAFEAMTGLSRNDILDKRVTVVLPELINSNFDWIGIYGRVALTGETASFESYSEPLQRWYEVTAYSDAPGYFAVIFHDITDKKKLEDTTRIKSGMLTSLLDSMPDLVFFKDMDGVYLGCNAEFAQHVGYAKKDIIGKTDYDLYSKVVADFFRENDRRMLELGAQHRNEEWISYPDGSRVLLDTLKTPYYDPDGKIIGILGISRDITERKEAEGALRKSEQMFRAAFEGSHDAITLVTKEGRFIDCNQRALDMFGFAGKEEFAGTRPAAFSPPLQADGKKSVEAADEYIRKVIENGYNSMEWLHQRKHGEVFPTEIIHTSYQVGSNTIIQANIRDITVRKEAEEALRRREQEFRALSENAPDVVARFDRNLRYLYVNPAVEKHTGIPREYFIRQTSEELELPVEQTLLRNSKLTAVFQSGREQEMYYEHPTPNGLKYYHSRLVPEFAPDGTVETVLSIARDITAIKEMEAALYQEKLKTEQMHRRALPEYLPKIPGLNLTASYMPAASLQGDYCNVLWHHNQLLLYLVDTDESRDDGVMQSLYVRKTIEDYLQAHAEDAPVSPALLLRYLQDRFQQDNQDETTSLCVFIAAFKGQPAAENAENFSPELLCYASTGFSTAPLLIKYSSNSDELILESLYLTMDDVTELQEHTLTVAPGSTYIFSTDGLFHQGRDRGSYELRLRELLKKQAHLPPELISQAVEADFTEFHSDYPLQNDLALLVVQVPREEQCLSFKLESEFQQISVAKEKVSSLLSKTIGLEPNLLHFHELLVNAVEHGNKQDGAKTVSIDLTVTDCYYKAVITDQGEGFNWKDRVNREMDLEGESERGRGIIMARMMTDYLGYNERGNRVIMINMI